VSATHCMHPAAQAEGCDFPGLGPHSFRRANITWRQQAGGSAIEASKIAGHSDIEMTGEYTFVSAERQNELTRRMQEMLANAAKRRNGTVPLLRASEPVTILAELVPDTQFGPPPSRLNLRPRRGPRTIAPASAMKPPMVCTTVDPAKSWKPVPREGRKFPVLPIVARNPSGPRPSGQ
jgi:hypothetical protein